MLHSAPAYTWQSGNYRPCPHTVPCVRRGSTLYAHTFALSGRAVPRKPPFKYGPCGTPVARLPVAQCRKAGKTWATANGQWACNHSGNNINISVPKAMAGRFRTPWLTSVRMRRVFSTFARRGSLFPWLTPVRMGRDLLWKQSVCQKPWLGVVVAWR